MKCGDCPNQAFLPVTADTVLGHLQGRHVIGVYPMLTDETCWFLAADFDKEAWREDVLAFTETCRHIGVPYAIERSRSGNGAHVWFLFSSPVSASTARKMGSYLITETMGRQHQLSMASYDRLFPNQDTLPNGGFGNLIALPLQYHPRQEGNTVFLDDSLEPFPNQWRFLVSLVPIPVEKIESIAMEASTRGQVIGLQIANTGEDIIEDSPWLRPPSRKSKCLSISEPHPTRGSWCIVATNFHRESGPSFIPHQPAQTTGCIPESGVLQEAESSAFDSTDTPGDHLRRRPRKTLQSAKGMSGRCTAITSGT